MNSPSRGMWVFFHVFLGLISNYMSSGCNWLMTRHFQSINVSFFSLSSSPGGCRLTTKPGMLNEGGCVFCLQTQMRKVNFPICLNGQSLCITSALHSFPGISLLSFLSVEGGGQKGNRQKNRDCSALVKGSG